MRAKGWTLEETLGEIKYSPVAYSAQAVTSPAMASFGSGLVKQSPGFCSAVRCYVVAWVTFLGMLNPIRCHFRPPCTARARIAGPATLGSHFAALQVCGQVEVAQPSARPGRRRSAALAEEQAGVQHLCQL